MLFVGPSRLSNDRKDPHIQQPIDHVNGARNLTASSPNTLSQPVKERTPSTSNGPTISIASALPQTPGKNDSNSRFTTSNFVESVITPSESVFADVQKNKKRKMNEINVAAMPATSVPSILDNQSSQQLLTEQQSPTTATLEPLQELERAINKPTASEEDYKDNDDDSGDLKFVEEPNLSTLKAALTATTS